MTADLRQSIRFAAYFLLAVFVLQYALASAGNFVVRHAPTRFSNVHAGQIDVDVLVIGNSRGERLLATQTGDTRLSAFNLSWGGLRRTPVVALIKEFFEAGNTADVLLIEASSLVLQDSGQCDLKSFWPILPNLEQSSRELCARDLKLANLFPLSRFNTQPMRRAVSYLLLQPDGDTMRDTTFGQTIRPEQCDNISLDGFKHFQTGFEQVDPRVVAHTITEIQSYVQTQSPGTTIIFALAPFVSSPSTQIAVRQIKAQAADLFESLNYIDLHESVPEGCGYFADAVHLNTQGIRLLRPVLENYIGLTLTREQPLSLSFLTIDSVVTQDGAVDYKTNP